MADKEKAKTKAENYFERDINPAVADRVDNLMDVRPDKPKTAKSTAAKESPVAHEATSAPLLPSEKLPIQISGVPIEKKPAAESADQISADESIDEARYKSDRLGINRPETERAVDEITSEEADRMLAIEDAKAELLAEGSAEIAEPGVFARLKSFFSNLWSHPSVKWLFVLGVLAIVSVIAIFPQTRYFVLNTAGVRSATSLTLVDSVTKQPLKDVEVRVSDQTMKTDKNGYVGFSNLKLGNGLIQAKKPGFAPMDKPVTLGWGSNPLGEISLESVGLRYQIKLSDYVSGRPVTSAEAISGSASAFADDKGELTLVVSDTENTVVAEIKAEGYRQEKIKLAPENESEKKSAVLVPDRKHAYVSKRGGNFDLYSSYIDGKDEKRIFAGTGNERAEDLILLANPTSEKVAFVSTRGTARSASGQALASLNIIDLKNEQTTEVVNSERIQLVDFIGSKLVFVETNSSAREDSPNRHRIISYDVESLGRSELAAASYFNDVVAAEGEIYYAPAGGQKNSTAGFYRIRPDGSKKENIYNKEIWNIIRSSYEKLRVSVGEKWFEYDLSNRQLNDLEGAPSSMESRLYTAQKLDSDKSLWVDQRDGKGALILYEKSKGKETVLASRAGLRNPISWLSDEHIIFRINSPGESADYVIGINGGEPKKIVDVTDTAGLDSWYIY